MNLMISADVAAIQLIESSKKMIVNLKKELTVEAVKEVITELEIATGKRGVSLAEYSIKIIRNGK